MKRKIIILALALIIVVAVVVKYVRFPVAVDVVKYFDFAKENTLKEWKEKIFKGRVMYELKKLNGDGFVLAASDQTASALFYKIKLDMDKHPVISWKWNAKKFPAKPGSENLKDAKQDDFAARVYIIFPAIFFTKSRALEYIWTQDVKEGTISASPYSRNLQLVVAQSGKGEADEWIYEERDIYNDYKAAFGEEPRYDIGAIAFMTDSDSTKSSAEAFYDDIKIGYKKEK